MNNTPGFMASKTEAGFNIVEMMVTLAVSTILLSGLVQLYISNKDNYNLQSSLATMQENTRFVSKLLGDSIRLAGYAANPNESGRTVYTSSVKQQNQVFTLTDDVLFLQGADNNSINGSDSIIVRYQGCIAPCEPVRDCLGNEIAADEVSYNHYFLNVNDDGIPQLRCSNNEPDAATDMSLTNVAGTALVDYVENMQIRYGVNLDAEDLRDVDNDPISVDRYYKASDISLQSGETPNWSQVVSVKIGLLMRSPKQVAVDNDTNNYILAGVDTVKTSGTTKHAGGLHIRRVVDLHYSLLNRGD